MTAEYEPDEDEGGSCGKEHEEIIGHVRYVHQKVDDITDRLRDSDEILQEILDSVNHENDASWYDYYANGNEY